MKFVILCLLHTLVWIAVTGSIAWPNLVLGLLGSAVAVSLVRETLNPGWSRVRPAALLMLAALFLKELAVSALRVAILVVQPKIRLSPGIFAYPLTLTRDFEIALLANLITLTPGTLSVDVSQDGKTLFVHALDCSDPGAIKRSIRNGFERRIRQAFPA